MKVNLAIDKKVSRKGATRLAESASFLFEISTNPKRGY